MRPKDFLASKFAPCWLVVGALATLLIGVLATLLIGCGGDPASTPRISDMQTSAVQTATTNIEEVSDEISVPAKVQADPTRVVHIFPPVSGRLVSLTVRPGDFVAAGQRVAIIASSDAASARSDFDKARIESQRAQLAESRAKLLVEHGALAQKELDDAKAQADSSKSELERARQRLHLLTLDENSTADNVLVRSPRSGVVLDIGAATGEFSKSLDNANALLTVADLSSIWVVGDLFEKDLASAARSSQVRITFAAFPGESWSGRISNISDVLDPNTRTMKIRVVLPNPGHRLKPEMFATIHLPRPKRNVIGIPSAAVLYEGNSAFVMVRKADGAYEKRSVTVAQIQTDQAEIASGLRPGEVVVVKGAELLRGEGAGGK
jgi:cobalt-zinc-cadmium efflux system membrane fusion protein